MLSEPTLSYKDHLMICSLYLTLLSLLLNFMFVGLLENSKDINIQENI